MVNRYDNNITQTILTNNLNTYLTIIVLTYKWENNDETLHTDTKYPSWET